MSGFVSIQEMSSLFEQGGMMLTEQMYEKYAVYAGLLTQWNERINLTAITQPDEIAQKHFYDSVFPFELAARCGVGLKMGASLIDVGTGAGFPSVPLKIYREDVRLTLLDSLNKRVNFLSELSDAVGAGAVCVHARAEEAARAVRNKNSIGGSGMRESFDAAAARAVANLTELCEYCLPFVKVGGRFFALKGKDGEAELAAADGAVKTLGGKVVCFEKYKLPCGDERTLIVIDKVTRTGDKFPRNAGQIRKRPL